MSRISRGAVCAMQTTRRVFSSSDPSAESIPSAVASKRVGRALAPRLPTNVGAGNAETSILNPAYPGVNILVAACGVVSLLKKAICDRFASRQPAKSAQSFNSERSVIRTVPYRTILYRCCWAAEFYVTNACQFEFRRRSRRGNFANCRWFGACDRCNRRNPRPATQSQRGPSRPWRHRSATVAAVALPTWRQRRCGPVAVGEDIGRLTGPNERACRTASTKRLAGIVSARRGSSPATLASVASG